MQFDISAIDVKIDTPVLISYLIFTIRFIHLPKYSVNIFHLDIFVH